LNLRLRVLAILALLMPLLGCSAVEPREDIEFAKHFVSLFPQHNTAEIEKEFTSSGDHDTLRAAIPKLIALYPPGRLKNVTVTWNEMFQGSTGSGSQRLVFIDLLYQFDGPGDLDVRIETTRENGKIVIQNVYFQPLPHSLIADNAFSFTGKGLLHYVVMLLAIAIPLVMIYALVRLWRSKTARWRWAWTIFILIGFFKLSFDWTTGHFFLSPLSVQLLGVSVLRASPYQPWLIGLSVPVGALLFLYRQSTRHDDPSRGF
jgi:hypothetical protein